jgi:hypothetical protein
MPSVTKFRPARRPLQEPLFLFDARRPATPASAEMIDHVITHADVCIRMGGERLKLRISEAMIETLQAQGKLGAGAHRLADLTVIWSEVEDQVVTVRDDARLRDAADQWATWDALWDEESYSHEAPRQSHAA